MNLPMAPTLPPTAPTSSSPAAPAPSAPALPPAGPTSSSPAAAPAPSAPALPMVPAQAPAPALSGREIAELKDEVRALAGERGAVILAHNYQVPEIQDVADYVGDSLGLSRRAAATDAAVIAFCGVHFMAETASILCPEKTVLIPDLDAGCSLAASIDAEQLAEWRARYPRGVVVMYVNTTAEVKALTDYCCTSANAVDVVRHIYDTRGPGTEILFGPDMWLGAYVEKMTGERMHVWDGECHVHAGIRPDDIAATRAAHPDADFLIHPECGCTTSIMEYVAAGDVSAQGVHMLSTGGMLRYAEQAASSPKGEREAAEELEEGAGRGSERPASVGGATNGQASPRRRQAIVATETGMLYPLRMAAPDVEFIPANAEASCVYMKMITLPKLRDALRDMQFEVRVPADVAVRARVPIDRMVALG
ncbi:MAG TPA: quinolinate synthase NadA [Solirubrobacteraceae bacterium]|nr:quinolinate synthase NadA [Solirubrobacteraceae bacterium]